MTSDSDKYNIMKELKRDGAVADGGGTKLEGEGFVGGQ